MVNGGAIHLSVLHTMLLLKALTDESALALAEDPIGEEDVLEFIVRHAAQVDGLDDWCSWVGSC